MLAYSSKPEISCDRLWRAVDQLPTFSPVLQKLLAAVSRQEVSFKQLAALVERDTVLAGHLLRLVNSAAGGFRSRVNSVTHAISLIGVVKLKNVLLGLSASQMWSRLRCAPSWSHARFNLHSIAVASFADLLIQEVPAVYPEGAFIAGLLHDLGRILIATEWRDQFEAEVRRRTVDSPGDSSWLDWERETCGVTHAELSAAVLARWQLPEAIQEAVGMHHSISLDSTSSAEPHSLEVWPLARVLAIADREAHRAGFTYLEKSSAAVGVDVPEVVSEPEPWSRLRAQFLLEMQPLQAFYLGLHTNGGRETTGS